MSVVVLSAKRCGSTIIQNVGYIVINKKKGRLKKIHQNRNIVKGNLILMPIRDPRDVSLSIRRTLIRDYYSKVNKKEGVIKDLNFLNNNIIIKQLDLMVELYEKYENEKKCLVLRYEEIFKNGLGDYEILVKELCGFFNVEFTDELNTLVHNVLNFNNLKKISSSMNSFKKNDMGTTSFGLHGGHIGSSSVSVWEEKIPLNLHEEYNEKLGKYLKRLNYKK